jgi:hypothetical protein
MVLRERARASKHKLADIDPERLWQKYGLCGPASSDTDRALEAAGAPAQTVLAAECKHRQ